MKSTDLTLREQMRLTELEIESRKKLFTFDEADVEALTSVKGAIEREINDVVARFYEAQTSLPEIALLIGDADTLRRLRSAQYKYIVDLFSGFYDIEYVNNRLRIGLVHKRIGVDPKLYLSAIHALKLLLADLIRKCITDPPTQHRAVLAIEKLLMFDVSLVFDTYIRSMIAEIETAKLKVEQYSLVLEEKVAERTAQLEQLSRTDPLTGLQNRRCLNEVMTQSLRAAQRRREVLTVAYFDINDFKSINDTYGHQRGDDVLRSLGRAIRSVSRSEDECFRYGGDEFCVVMSNCTEAQARQVYSQRLMNEFGNYEKEIDLSIGYVETGPDEYVTCDELIRLADVHMYAEKMSSKKIKIA